MMDDFNGLRGSRRTRPLALGLLGMAACLGLIAVAAVAWAVASGSDGQTRGVSLMAVDSEATHADADADADADLAPSRPVPGTSAAAAAGAASVRPTRPAAATAAPARPETSPAALAAPVADDGPAPTFGGRPLRKVQTLRMLTTAYSPDERSCGPFADGVTASGYSVWTNGMKLVAADTKLLPFGSIVSIPGYHGGKPVPVLDRGGRIKGQRLDLLYPTHELALVWGAQRLDVTVWEYADE